MVALRFLLLLHFNSQPASFLQLRAEGSVASLEVKGEFFPQRYLAKSHRVHIIVSIPEADSVATARQMMTVAESP